MWDTFANDSTMDVIRAKQSWAKKKTGTKAINCSNINFKVQLINAVCIALISTKVERLELCRSYFPIYDVVKLL